MKASDTMASAIHILLVDDENTFRESTADLLISDGYHCDTATNAKSAIEKISESEYDVLISDIKMPGNDQLELIHKVKDIVPGLPTILVTGYPSVQTAIDSIKLPVIEYLTKPFEYDELVAAVSNAVTNRDAQKIVRKSEKRIDDWHKELVGLTVQMQNDFSPLTTNAYFTQTMVNIVASLKDLQNMTDLLPEKDSEESACSMFDCSRVKVLVDTISQTIDTLEKTRTSFKSKELYQLRKKLEKVIVSIAVGEQQL